MSNPGAPQGRLQERLDALAPRYGVPGAAVGVLDGGRLEVAATGVTSVRTGLAVTLDTLFQLGSITKAYTATLVLQLVDRGEVELDAPVVTYLPDLAFADAEATRAVTVRQLLSHTSGVEGDHFPDTGRGDDAVERYVATLAGVPQLHAPGAMMSYCNAGYVVLGRLVERLAGAPFRVALRERLLEPAGLDDTVSLPEEAILRRTAVGHLPDSDADPGADPGAGADAATERLRVAPVWSLPPGSAPAGTMLCATVTDLLGFARLHLDDGRVPRRTGDGDRTDRTGGTGGGAQVVSPAATAAMREPQVLLHDTVTHGEAWGLGWILYRWDGTRLFGHDGATVGQASVLRVLPGRRAAVALLANGGRVRGLYRALFDELLRERCGVGVPALPTPSEASDLDPAAYAGTYERLGVRTDLAVRDGRLVASTTLSGPLAAVLPDPEDRPLAPAAAPPAPPGSPAASTTLFMMAPEREGDPPQPVVFFDLGTAGRPGWLHTGARAMRRVA